MRTHGCTVGLLIGLCLAGFGCATSKAGPPKGRTIFDARAVARYAIAPRSIEPALDPRRPGDFAVFRVTGALLDEPRTLTQRVIARQGAVLVMDYDVAFASGVRDSLRVSIDLVAQKSDAVFAVSRIALDAEQEVAVGALDTLLSGTSLGADLVEHEEVFRTPAFLRTVGDRELECEESSTRVTVRGVDATRSAKTCAELAWGPIEEEIVADDGSVLHRRELVELGESDPRKPIFVAAASTRWMY